MRRNDRIKKDPEWIYATLSEGLVCHLALTDGSNPYAIALNYGFRYDGAEKLDLFFHCATEGRKLDLIRINPSAAFIIDSAGPLVTGAEGCDWGMQYRSIAGTGIIQELHDHAQRKTALDLLMHHYSGRKDFTYNEKILAATTILVLTVDSFSGKEKS